MFYNLVCLYANCWIFVGVEIITCWNNVAQNWGTTFHFDCVPPASVELKYYFCQLCIFTATAGIARQAFQYSGSVAYLFPLTVAAVLEGGAVHIFQSIDSSNLTVRARIKLFVLASRVATHQTKKNPDDLFENTQIAFKKPSLLIIPL